MINNRKPIVGRRKASSMAVKRKGDFSDETVGESSWWVSRNQTAVSRMEISEKKAAVRATAR